MVIVFASPILSPSGPPMRAPAPYMKDAIIDTMPISVFVTAKFTIIKVSRGDAMTNSEWLSEWAAPSNAKFLFLFSFCSNLLPLFHERLRPFLEKQKITTFL
jgi:hypothetical protein